MNKKRILEVCVDSVESAIAAKNGGADRLELCADLIVGGTTPSPALLRAVKRETGLPVHVLLRPRFGDFLYSDLEFAVMKEEAQELLNSGADAIVSGVLTADGELDLPRMRELVELAHQFGRKFTLHRAFDVCCDPIKALHDCKALSLDTVLTSGQAQSCTDGVAVLKALFAEDCGVEILIGAGVSANVIRTLREEIPQACAFHMSGKSELASGMKYRKEGVSMGLPMMSEFVLWRTDEKKIRRAREELDREL